MLDYSKFDLATFAILLEKAKGDRSINKYANAIDVSAAHISRLLRKLIKAPPSPYTINKMSRGAYNGVTYSDLMLAAGHIDDISKETSSGTNQIQTVENKKKFFNIILSDIFTRDFEWTLNKTIDGPADLMLEITNWEYSKWYIQIKPFASVTTLYNVYGQIATSELTSDIKVSIAVGSQKEFNLFVNKPPKSLKANVYVMLVDIDNGRIIKEDKLCHY